MEGSEVCKVESAEELGLRPSRDDGDKHWSPIIQASILCTGTTGLYTILIFFLTFSIRFLVSSSLSHCSYHRPQSFLTSRYPSRMDEL